MYGADLVSIAADGDRIAVTEAWSWAHARDVYISNDAGQSWSTMTVANPSENGAHLYVLADKRLLLVRSIDPHPVQLLVSTGSDWTNLEEDLRATQAITGSRSTYVRANRAGIVFRYLPATLPDETFNRQYLSTDLENWQTIPVLNDQQG